MRRASNSQSGGVSTTGLPINLRTQSRSKLGLGCCGSITNKRGLYMPDESPENCPDPKSNDTSKKKRLKKIRPAWLSDVVAGYVCISFATPIWVGGGSLLNSRPKPILLAWGLIFAGFCFFAFAVEFWVVNHRKRQTDNKIPLSLTTWLRFGII